MGRHPDPRFARINGRGVVEAVLEPEGRKDGNVGGLGKALQRGLASGRPGAAAGQDQRASGPGQHGQALVQGGGQGGGFRDLGRAGQGGRVRKGGKHILGQCDDDGAGAAGGGGLPGAGQDFRDAVHPVDLDGPFRHAAEDGRIVDFLERLASDHVGADLAHQDQHGCAVLHRGVDADGGVGDARPARDQADAGLAGQLAPGSRHEGRAPFVAAQHEIKPSPCVVQRVQHRQVTFARNAKGLGRAKRHQAIHQQCPAVSCHVAPFVRASLSAQRGDCQRQFHAQAGAGVGQ